MTDTFDFRCLEEILFLLSDDKSESERRRMRLTGILSVEMRRSVNDDDDDLFDRSS